MASLVEDKPNNALVTEARLKDQEKVPVGLLLKVLSWYQTEDSFADFLPNSRMPPNKQK